MNYVQIAFFILLFAACNPNTKEKGNTEEQTIIEQISTEDYSQFNGIFKRDKEFGSGVLYLEYIGENKVDFLLNVSDETGSCSGYIEDVALIDSQGIANYKADNCENLNFQLKENKVEIVETNCELYGLNCGFNGIYIKKENKE